MNSNASCGGRHYHTGGDSCFLVEADPSAYGPYEVIAVSQDSGRLVASGKAIDVGEPSEAPHDLGWEC